MDDKGQDRYWGRKLVCRIVFSWQVPAFQTGEYKWKSLEDADVHVETLPLDPLGLLAEKSRQDLPIQA